MSKEEDKISKKSDSYCFQNFIECIECECRAAKMLEDNLNHFDIGLLQDKLDELYRTEHDVDKRKRGMMAVLVKAFITPIEQEDIILLSQSIDEMTDEVEDILIRIYINNVQQIRPEVLVLVKVIIRCYEAFKEVMEEFAGFRKSKTLHGLTIEINALEEEGDRLFVEFMRRLHAEVTDPIKITAWKKIYVYLERCCDACKYVAGVVKDVIIENT